MPPALTLPGHLDAARPILDRGAAVTSTRMGRAPTHRRANLAGVIGLVALLLLLAFATTGGFDSSVTVSAANTWAEIALLVIGAGACAALLVLEIRGLGPGTLPAALFTLLTAFTALSILWSVQPDNSWQASNLTVAFLLAFVTGIAAARIAPARWPALVAGLGITMVAVCGYGLLTKIAPAWLAPGDTEGRLQLPLGYWNAMGAVAGMGLGPCLWAWQRRDARPLARALAAPAAVLLLTVTVLSYSRTALLVIAIVAALWLALVPDRLRAVALMLIAGAGAAILSAWALHRPALTAANMALADRDAAGHTYGLICAVVLIVAAAAAWAVAVGGERWPLSATARRRGERALWLGLALLPVLLVLALATSSRGLTGEISHGWSSLTSTNPSGNNAASRIGQLGSTRPLYWTEGIDVGEHALLKGVGALGYATARTRYTLKPEVAEHAHSYIVQTFADLGLIGLIINLALLIAWGRATLRAIGRAGPPADSGWASGAGRIDGGAAARRDAERTGLIALAALVVAYGCSSATDWTYFFPGVTVPALLAAGWLTGRGRTGEPVTRPERPRSLARRPGTGAAITGLSALTLIVGWLVWQPLRAARAVSSAEAAAARGDSRTAFADAHTARAADPLSLQPRFLLAQFDTATHDFAAARRQLTGAVDLQPANPQSWLQLGSFDLSLGSAKRALPALQHAYLLDPTDPTIQGALAAARALTQRPGAAAVHRRHRHRHRHR